MTTTAVRAPSRDASADDHRNRDTVSRFRAVACPICGTTPRRRARGGPPELIGAILDDVVHNVGRCPRGLLAEYGADGDGR